MSVLELVNLATKPIAWRGQYQRAAFSLERTLFTVLASPRRTRPPGPRAYRCAKPRQALSDAADPPSTARELGFNPFVPEQNIEGGVRYFSKLLRTMKGWQAPAAQQQKRQTVSRGLIVQSARPPVDFNWVPLSGLSTPGAGPAAARAAAPAGRRFADRVVRRNHKQIGRRLGTVDIGQPIFDYTGAGIGVPRVDQHLQLGRLPALIGDLILSIVANLPGRNDRCCFRPVALTPSICRVPNDSSVALLTGCGPPMRPCVTVIPTLVRRATKPAAAMRGTRRAVRVIGYFRSVAAVPSPGSGFTVIVGRSPRRHSTHPVRGWSAHGVRAPARFPEESCRRALLDACAVTEHLRDGRGRVGRERRVGDHWTGHHIVRHCPSQRLDIESFNRART